MSKEKSYGGLSKHCHTYLGKSSIAHSSIAKAIPRQSDKVHTSTKTKCMLIHFPVKYWLGALKKMLSDPRDNR